MSAMADLSETDREALRRTARDLSDIDPRTRARIAADFERAYAIAAGIANGTLDPLTA